MEYDPFEELRRLLENYAEVSDEDRRQLVGVIKNLVGRYPDTAALLTGNEDLVEKIKDWRKMSPPKIS